MLVSCDQQLAGSIGAFVRVGHQTDGSAIDYDTLYSGGVELAGDRWGRASDTVGIGYAHLDGGNVGLGSTRVFESYYRLVIVRGTAITADVQHVHDGVRDGDDASGWVFGLRATYGF